jgi:2-dehydropantoate 2-reductase
LGEKLSVVVVGAGAIGLSLTGWLFPYVESLHLLARGNSLVELRDSGVQLCHVGQGTKTYPAKVIASLDDVEHPDIILLTVKNYDIEAAAKMLRQQLGNEEPILVSLQNGVENQRLVPKYFSRAVFGVVCYNAWREGPGLVKFVKPGHVVIGALTAERASDLQTVARVLSQGLRCDITDHLQDAIHCKLVINLINGLMALVGFRKRSIESEKILVHMTTRLLAEGVAVLQAAGFREQDLGVMPSWHDIEVAVDMPESVENPLYDFIINRTGPTSMTQDVYGGKTNTELESLNGYMLELSRRVGVPMPINQAIYEIAKERLRPGFTAIEESDLWEMINNRILGWSYPSDRALTRKPS